MALARAAPQAGGDEGAPAPDTQQQGQQGAAAGGAGPSGGGGATQWESSAKLDALMAVLKKLRDKGAAGEGGREGGSGR